MDTKTIIKGNRAIAEFMGFIWEEKYNGFYKPNPEWSMGNQMAPTWIEKIDNGKAKYHTSWEWLMPVVEKIETLSIDNYGELGVIIYTSFCQINGSDCLIIESPSCATKIESVWIAVTKFIQWYNTKQSTSK